MLLSQKETMSENVQIYTDGAARGNPGRGGYGIVMMYGAHKKELSAGYRHTTNNRMELLAVIVALESLTKPNLGVDIYSDSSYVVNTIEKRWVNNWMAKGGKGKKNLDLWRRYMLIAKQHRVKMRWVKGHAENIHNNRCDELATAAADAGNLLVDEGYEAAVKELGI